MTKSIIVHGRADWGMAAHADRIRKHFGLAHVVVDFDGRRHEAEGYLYIAYCYLPGCTPATMRVMSFADVAQQINAAIPLTDWQSGPPPMVGEWNARRIYARDMDYFDRRWWSGEGWSCWFWTTEGDSEKNRSAGKGGFHGCEEIEWRGLSQEPIKVTP